MNRNVIILNNEPKNQACLQQERRDDKDAYCPFTTGVEQCGSWCPHFELDAPAGVVRLTCSGMRVEIGITNADEVRKILLPAAKSEEIP